MTIDTNIQKNLTPDEKEVFSIIRKVIEQYTPSTSAYAVGGWTRDKLLGTPSDDIDVMLDNISGEDFAKLVTQYMNIKDPHVIKSNPDKSKHITTAKTYIPLSSGKTQEIDFAQARAEVYKDDSRIPDLKPATPKEDAYRRDLTINSLFYDIKNNQIEDFTGKGIRDLISMTIRTPENPLKTFSDDPLRIFRTIRFAAKYNGKIDTETKRAMTDSSLLDDIKQKVSKERIGVEFTKMLKGPNPEVALNLLKDTGLFENIITEALKNTDYEDKLAPLDMEQNNPHHELTVWGHTMETVKHILDLYPETEPEKRTTMILAALMHDIGKLYYEIHSESKTHPGQTSYIGHEIESRNILEHILKYLKLEPYIQQVGNLVRSHMRPHIFTERGQGGKKAMRKFIRQMGEKSLEWIDVLNLSIADAYSKGLEVNPETIKQYQGLENQLREALSTMKEPSPKGPKPILDGNEIMQILNIKPGPWMSDLTEFVKDLEDENPNVTKEEAAKKLKEKYLEIQSIQKNNTETITASRSKDPKSLCSRHLLHNKIDEINNAFKNKRYFNIQSIIKNLVKEYGNDENIARLAAITMFNLLLINEKYRDTEVLQYIFNKAEKTFFDYYLCPYAVAILLLIKTATEDNIIEEIAKRMVKMNPNTLKRLLNLLPKEIAKPKLKNKIKKMLK